MNINRRYQLSTDFGPRSPDLVPGQPLYLHGSGYPGGKIVNSAAFAVPPNLQDGDLGRNVLRGFGAWQIDFSLHREVPLSDHLHLEFRVETFNILNHPNFGDPSAPGAPGVILLGSGAGFGTSGQTLANSLWPRQCLGPIESSLSDWWAADNSIRGPSAFLESPRATHTKTSFLHVM